MRARSRVPATLMIAACALASAGTEGVLAADPNKGPLKLDLSGDSVSWEDQQKEASYHVSGSINYQPPASCGVERLRIDGERVSFDDSLPANTTSFSFPRPKDVRLTFKKDWQFAIEALGASNNVMVQDGSALVADLFCTDEEMAAQLAVAGSGSKTASNGHATVVASLLAVVGLASLGTSVLLKRRDARC